MTDQATPSTPSAPSTSDLQAAAAAAAGLDPKFAPRLQGAGLAEMVADARAFAEQIAPPAAPAEAAPEQPPAAAVVVPTLTAADGVTGGPERREQPGMSLDAMRQLARKSPADWNRRAEAGEFDHLLGWGKAR